MQTSRPGGFVNALRDIFGRRGDAWFVGVALLLGLVAFAWAGFLANPELGNPSFPNNPVIQFLFFKEPWLLFVWFCMLVVTVQLSILLDPQLPESFRPGGRRVVATLVVSVVCILIVVVLRLSSLRGVPQIDLAKWIGDHHSFSLAVLNLGLLAIFWASALLSHLFPGARGEGDEQRQSLSEGLIGDLLAGIIFALLLALVFSILHLQDVSQHTTAGFVKWDDAVCQWQQLGDHAKTCPPEGLGASEITSVNFLSTLVFFDLALQPILYAVLALILLTFAATLNTLANDEPAAFGTTFVEIGARIIRRFIGLADVTRRLRVFWPWIALLAFFSIGISAEALQQYIFKLELQWHAYFMPTSQPPGKIAWVLWPYGFQLPDGYPRALLALLTGVTALVAAVASVALQLIPRSMGPASFWRASAYIRQHLVRYVLWLATSYWAYSLILSLLNQLGLFYVQFAASRGWVKPDFVDTWLYAPFVQPDPLMILSFLAFIFVTVRSRRRKGRGVPPTPEPVGVGAAG